MPLTVLYAWCRVCGLARVFSGGVCWRGVLAQAAGFTIKVVLLRGIVKRPGFGKQADTASSGTESKREATGGQAPRPSQPGRRSQHRDRAGRRARDGRAVVDDAELPLQRVDDAEVEPDQVPGAAVVWGGASYATCPRGQGMRRGGGGHARVQNAAPGGGGSGSGRARCCPFARLLLAVRACAPEADAQAARFGRGERRGEGRARHAVRAAIVLLRLTTQRLRCCAHAAC